MTPVMATAGPGSEQFAAHDLFRAAFEAAPVGMALIDLNGWIEVVNAATCELLGRTEDELVGAPLEALADGEHIEEDVEKLVQCVAGTLPVFTAERRVLHGRTGQERWVELHISVLRNRRGRPAHMVAHVVDMTERRAAMQATATAEARFAAMVEHGSDLIAVADTEGRLRYASPGYRTVLGLDPATWLGQELLDRVHPDDRSAVVTAGAAIATEPGASTTLVFRYQHLDGSWLWMEATMSNQLEHPGVRGYVINSHDVTARVESAEQLRHEATHDPLTGLANRGFLTEHLARVVAERRPEEVVAALYIDLDHFKSINDTHGHAAGDRLLVEVAERLSATSRSVDTVARLGGDEFVVVAVVADRRAAEELAERACEAFAAPFDLDDVTLAITASVGLATSDDDLGGIDLLQASDLALYEAKSIGRNGWVGYLPHLRRSRPPAATGDSRPRPVAAPRARASERCREFVSSSTRPLLVDVDGVIVATSGPALELLRHHDDSTIVGRHVLELAPSDHLEVASARLELLRAGAWPDPGTVELCSLDGSRVEVMASSVPITWGGNDAVLTDLQPLAPGLDDARQEQLVAHLPAQIPAAIAEGQLVVAYQPIVDLDGVVHKVEALVRWQHPTLGLLLPGVFMPAVEHSPHMGALTGEVLRQACHQVAAWRADGMPDLEVTVNISRRELIDTRIIGRVRKAVASSGLPASALWLEATETAMAVDHPRARRTIDRLRALGVRFALDDFGTGFATLAQLHRFPSDALKIDRLFVDGLPDDDGDAAIVRSVLTLGRELGLHVIAEGVETQAQHDALVAMGCTLFQGYLFARPAMPEASPRWASTVTCASA